MSHTHPRFAGFALRENGLWFSDTTVGNATSAKHGLCPKIGSGLDVLDGVLVATGRDFAMESIIGDGVNVITTGWKGQLEVPAAGTILSSRLFADASGSITLTVKKSTFAGLPGSLVSIVASAKPTLASAQKSEDMTLTGWTTSVAAGDILEWTVDTIATLKQATHSLIIRRS